MTDSLRGRIAAVVSLHNHPLYCEKCPPRVPTPQDYKLADAVIAALKAPQPCRNYGVSLVRDWEAKDD